jgi:transcriptional regulator of acetoin/glycerol metabolism
VIERAFVHCKDGWIDLKHLPEEITMFPKSSSGIKTLTVHNLIDIQAIQTALERNNNNRGAAAKALGIHKTTLYRRMKKLGIFLPKKASRSQDK